MSNEVKDTNIKNHTHYFSDDIINVKDFNPNNIKIDEKSYENILIYYIWYVTIKDSKYTKIWRVNPLHLLFSKVNEYFGEVNKSKYLTLVSTKTAKEKLKNMKNYGKKSGI